jgi:riboflavin kinase
MSLASSVYTQNIPFQPWAVRAEIISGFQRGGAQLGFPTANLQLDEQITTFLKRYLNTVWVGLCVIEGDSIVEGSDIEGLAKSFTIEKPDPVQQLVPFRRSSSSNINNNNNNNNNNGKQQNSSTKITKIYPTVLSVGTNPHFKNVALTLEPYICHKFKEDFYGRTLRLVAVQPLRTMGAFTTLDALKAQIWEDCVVGSKLLMGNSSFISSALKEEKKNKISNLKDVLLDPEVFVTSDKNVTTVFKSYSSSTESWQSCEEMNSSQL